MSETERERKVSDGFAARLKVINETVSNATRSWKSEVARISARFSAAVGKRRCPSSSRPFRSRERGGNAKMETQ